MNHFLTLVILLFPFAFVSAEKADAPQQDIELKSDGCFLSPSSVVKQSSVLNKLSKKVHFLNSDNATFSLEQRMKDLKINAVSIAAIKNNKIDWSTAHGITRFGSLSTVSCKTLFQAASVSKPVTMMAVLRMAEHEVVNLDLDIQEYLTSFDLPKGKQTKKNPITFRNLLDHTSGITPGGYYGYAHSVNIPSDVDIVRGIEPANSTAIEVLSLPGTQLRYSGGAYTIAEIALQDIFKQPFETIMNDWVFVPTGMKTADFSQPIMRSKHSSIAQGHHADGTTIEGGWNIYPEQAAAGLWSNANDLARFAIEIGKGYRGQSKVFSKSIINELLSHKIDNHLYGFLAHGENENLAIVHYGGNSGYRTAMVLNLESGDGVVVLTSSDNGSLLINEILLSMSNQYEWPHFKKTFLTKTSVNKKLLKRFAGKYAFAQQGWQVDVKYDESINSFSIVFPNKDQYLLTATTTFENHFIHPDTGVEVVFSDKNRQVEIQLYGQVGTKI